MSIKECINSAVDQGEFTLEEGQQLQKRFDALFKKLNSRGAARQQLIDELEAEAAEKKRRALLTETRRKVLAEAVLSHRNASGAQDPAEALTMMLEHFGGAKFEDVEHKRLAILGQTHAELEALLHEFRKGAVSGDKRRSFGQAKAKLENVVRELFGEDTGDQSAKGLAQAWSDVSESLRQRFNAAGGAVGKLEKWGLPQHHDQLALLNVGMHDWVKRITPMLDRRRTVNQLTGHQLTDDELREALEAIWKNITSEGWHKRGPTGAPVGKGALFKQHADHRFLHFKSADDWLAYQRDFGEGDPFAAMMGHVSTMARDIAAMEVMGPNPEAMMNYLKQLVQSHAARARPVQAILDDLRARVDAASKGQTPLHQEYVALLTDPRVSGLQRRIDQLAKKKSSAAIRKHMAEMQDELAHLLTLTREKSKQINDEFDVLSRQLQEAIAQRQLVTPPPGSSPTDRANAAIKKAEAMWDVMRGSANAPVNSRIANGLSTARNLVSAAVLGSASVSAISDVAFQNTTRRFVGLHKSGNLQILPEVIGALSTGTKREAVRSGLILDSAVHAMHSQARYAGTFSTKTFSSFLVDRTLTLSGLTPWTQAGKHAFGLAFQAEIADRAGLSLDALPPLLRRTFDRHGIDAAAWDAIRSSPLHEPQSGATFLRPAEIADGALREKYQAMIMREMRRAVPEGTVGSQSMLTFGQPGTLVGELGRNFAQFKSFGVAVIILHGGRMVTEMRANGGLGSLSGWAAGASYAVPLLITGTIYGALAMQIKELVQGRDPRSMNSAGFWGGAMLQAGGLGIYGDFLFSGVNRFGGGLTSTVAGPLVGKVDTLRNTTIGNVLKQADDESKSNLGRDVVKLAKDWTPGGSIWYLRAAYERKVLDQLQLMIDPDGQRALRRKMQMQKKNFGNEYWWRPGETAPHRFPQPSR